MTRATREDKYTGETGQYLYVWRFLEYGALAGRRRAEGLSNQTIGTEEEGNGEEGTES